MTSPDAAFRALQRRLHPLPAHESRDHPEQTIVVLPSFDVDPHTLERHVSTQPAYEERFLYLLFLLGRVDIRVVFTSSLPVDPVVIDYYLGLLSEPAIETARDRLHLVSPDDPSPRPVAAKLLERPDLVAEIGAHVSDREAAFILPYNVGAYERDLALALELPVYGPSPELSHFGTKSGSRELFAAAGVRLPAGREDVADVVALTAGVTAIRRERPETGAVVVKLNDRVYGEGNRIVSLAGLPSPGSPQERAAVEERLRSLPDEYLADLAGDPGVVEELVEAAETRSPSVVMRILADGTPGIVYTQDQLLGGESGQTFVGSRFPAEADYASVIIREGERVRDRLQQAGMIGRFGIDFVVARDNGGDWQAYAIEVNLREGGTSHPFGALYLLTGGDYDAAASTFRTPAGEERFYTASDDLSDPGLVGVPVTELLVRAEEAGLQFERETQVGCVFHMLRSLPVEGKCGVTAIGSSRRHADELYQRTQKLLERMASERARSPEAASSS